MDWFNDFVPTLDADSHLTDINYDQEEYAHANNIRLLEMRTAMGFPPLSAAHSQGAVRWFGSVEALERPLRADHSELTDLCNVWSQTLWDPRSSEGPPKKVHRLAIDERQKDILTTWIAGNPEPYPSRKEKITLASSTGLSVDQISGWFTRTRQRALKRVEPAALEMPPATTTSPVPNGMLATTMGRQCPFQPMSYHRLPPERTRNQ
ncbi:hypothetical protein GGR57DRAFT_405786 [Xylariaceae sp. FL1272]|nr:hypothetical protein GGR57DRAFT_405786 [Xylariaceae sp. FL1272]